MMQLLSAGGSTFLHFATVSWMSLAGPGEFSAGYYAAAFLDCNSLVVDNVREFIYQPAGPLDLKKRDTGLMTESKGEDKFTLRKITGATTHHLPLASGPIADAYYRANTISVGTCASQLYAKTMVLVFAVVS